MSISWCTSTWSSLLRCIPETQDYQTSLNHLTRRFPRHVNLAQRHSRLLPCSKPLLFPLPEGALLWAPFRGNHRIQDQKKPHVESLSPSPETEAAILILHTVMVQSFLLKAAERITTSTINEALPASSPNITLQQLKYHAQITQGIIHSFPFCSYLVYIWCLLIFLLTALS